MKTSGSSSQRWPGYRSNLSETVDDFLSLHRSHLRSLVGKRLRQLWFPWHVEWKCRWVDGPLVLEFEETRLELEGCCCMFSACWNTLNLSVPPADELIWVHELPDCGVEELVGQKLAGVKLITCDGGELILGLEFTMENGAIFNVLDGGDETAFEVGRLPRESLFSIAFS